MNFYVDQERKRTWNHGWWRDWTQGKVAIVVACVCVTGLVMLAVYATLTLDPAALAAETRELGNRPETTRLAALSVVSGVLLTGAAIAIGGVLRHRNEPARQLTNETLTIEDGVLTLTYHRRYDPVRDGVDVASARLDRCAFWWDAKRRQLVIDAKERGAVREWHYAIPAQVGSVPFEQMRPCSFMRFYPYYDPDLISALRSMGVEERGPRSTFWEV